MDSPGHCAQYCTYTVMDNNTKQILSVVTVDKRETGKSSVRMEKEAFVRTLHHLDTENVKVGEVVTDAHTSIAAYLSMFFVILFYQYVTFILSEFILIIEHFQKSGKRYFKCLSCLSGFNFM
jgi:hypothetical protein